VIGIGLVVCQVLLGLCTLYGLYQAYLSAWPVAGPPRKPPEDFPHHRFAVISCGKNEAAVIDELLASLANQDYPKECYEVFVIADNCTDETARIARELGATVYERHDEEHIGKGYALRWFFDRFRVERADEFDAAVIFDSDNVAAPRYLSAMNRHINAGVEFALGYRLSKNPSESWVAGAMSLMWLCQIRWMHRARMRRGLSCLSTGGTGCMFLLSLLPDGRWPAVHLAEDIEFTMQEVIDGHTLALAPDAEFYDEQPVDLWTSCVQRYRWQLGALQTVGECLPGLWRSLPTRGRQTFDAFLFVLGPVVFGLSGVLGVLSTALTLAYTGDWLLTAAIMAGLAVFWYAGTVIVCLVTLRLERAHWPGQWKAVASFPFFMLTWQVIYTWVLFYRQPSWTPIPHSAKLNLETAARRRPNPLLSRPSNQRAHHDPPLLA
jgi:cellulose synthase/poly-beta-1,6-N-acetylglucosamine synthase-like glycosyltransferase